jgi:hypothetical protein
MKNRKQTLEEVVESMADECKANEQNNLAIVLYAYLGSKKAGLDRLFAKHCQDFARSGLDMIKDMESKENNR